MHKLADCQSFRKGLQLNRLHDLSIQPDKELTMNTHTLYRNLTTGLFFIAGISELFSGQFILATMFLGLASLASNLQSAKPVRH